jgi:hypothetical protein
MRRTVITDTKIEEIETLPGFERYLGERDKLAVSGPLYSPRS